MNKVIIINVVGLSLELVDESNMPHINKFLVANSAQTTVVEPPFPALTCVSQANYLTGTTPSEHGITANGYYDQDICEIRNWHQSSKLLQKPRLFTKVKERGGTVFSNCFWHSMYDDDIDYMVCSYIYTYTYIYVSIYYYYVYLYLCTSWIRLLLGHSTRVMEAKWLIFTPNPSHSEISFKIKNVWECFPYISSGEVWPALNLLIG